MLRPWRACLTCVPCDRPAASCARGSTLLVARGRRAVHREGVRVLTLLGVVATTLAAACRSTPVPRVAAQQPSPMRETARAHTRLSDGTDAGLSLRVEGVLPAPIEVFVPQRVVGSPRAPLVLHFMGATWLPRRAVASMRERAIVAAVHLGAGSAINARPFAGDTTRFAAVLQAIDAQLANTRGAPRVTDVYLSAWSAGYGAVRQVLRHPASAARVRGILLMDGLHASYRPEGTPLANGGAIDSLDLAPFLPFAQRAIAGDVRFMITHSEIFPGSFASTTETADWLLERLRLARTPVLEWGPGGMQLISQATSGHFSVIGFAGNSAPDHVDHLHGMAAFLTRLLAP